MAEQEEFKFPDEQAEKETEDLAIEVKVEDDTPEQDRNKSPLPKKLVDELENDDLEDYSEKVKKRLSQMKKVWHDERRAKETAAREKEEALRFAQQQFEENKRLKQRLGSNEKALIKEAERAAGTELSVAKERLKQAYDSGDSEKITEAQELLTDAKIKIQNLSRFRPTLQESKEVVQTSQKQAPTPQYAPEAPDPKAEAWREKNTWFGVDEEMTALALGLHEKLVRSGVDPRSEDYYRRVDETMRKRYPEAFDDAEEEKPTQTKGAEKPARTNKPATVVAPVTRGTAPRQVRLTSSQVAIAKKLGLSNEQYAKELMKLENNNG